MPNLKKTCFLFSGQGSQYQGMGQELLSLCDDAQKIYQCGSDILGFDLKALCFEADEITLSKTTNAQPAIFATSLVAYLAVWEKGFTPDAVAGHSLGEYAAMVASGILTMEQGFEVIKKRAHSMEQGTSGQDGAMCAVMGVDHAELLALCDSIDGYVVPVNFNSAVQTVIAGESSAIAKAMEALSMLGKKAVKLNVSAAFHSKLMQESADMFYASIRDVAFSKPNVPFYSNVTGAQLTDFSDMPTYLRTHLVSPVMFRQELVALKQDGFEHFIECGPNKVLTGLVKKTLTDVTAQNVENAKSLEKLTS